MEICLGTVQFGLEYGVKEEKRPTLEESFEILKCAIDSGIKVFDTAFAYGEAEDILGKFFTNYPDYRNRVKIISKLQPNIIELNKDKEVYFLIKTNLQDSLKKLGLDRIDGYLFHSPRYIYNEDAMEALVRLKTEGYYDNLGVSIYEAEDAINAAKDKRIDYIQYPYSVLDQRLEETNFFDIAKKNNKVLFARSAFLQGLLVMDVDKVPKHLEHSLNDLKELKRLGENYNIKPLDICIEFTKQRKETDYFVMGVHTLEQLSENIEIFNKENEIHDNFFKELKEKFSNVDKSIVMPSLWTKY